MSDRSRSQKIGSKGQRWIMAQIEEHPDWLARGLDEDFGVDAEAELTEDGIAGQILKLQVKTSEHVERGEEKVKLTIDRKYIEYAKSCRYPVILVRVDISDKKAWYLWLQQWILERRAVGDRLDSQQSYTVWVDELRTLGSGLDSHLKDIARWRGETQLVLSLLDAMRAAVATYNDKLTAQIVSLLTLAAPEIADTSLDIIAQEALILGESLRGTAQGNVISQQLFSLVRAFGNRLSVSSVDAIVRRGDGCSRTGLAALGILYDEHPQHIISLSLPAHFIEIGLPEVAYYCAFREASLDRTYSDFFEGPGTFVFAGLRFSCPPEISFGDKYANRGPSAILDFLIPEEENT